MKAPSFWYRPPEAPGMAARILAPLGALYAAATARRVRQSPEYKAGVPVICVGNINVGGTGKTPTVAALAQLLQAHGLSSHVVSRGYGGRLAGPIRVNEMSHSAAEVGDEPLLLAAFAPTWVSRNRARGVQAAEAAGADVILLDDGFQNPSVHKDLSIVVVDAHRGFGNARVLPAGPLREPVPAGLARADLVMLIGEPPAQTAFLNRWKNAIRQPVLRARLAPLSTGMDWQDMRVLAFAGIADPEKFFRTLRAQGADLARTVALEDHQPIGSALVTRLEAEARLLGAQLVTTEKDAVRLAPESRSKVLTLPVRLSIENPAPLDAALTALGLPLSS